MSPGGTPLRARLVAGTRCFQFIGRYRSGVLCNGGLAAFHSGMTSSGPDDIVAVDISGSLAVYSGNPSMLSYFIGAPVVPSIIGGIALDWSGV